MREAIAFFVHLRWHYQVLILSGGFLLGGLYHEGLDLRSFGLQFLVVHLLLNGGVTAYNSYWDDDDGPIGGLENPPKMTTWMLPASIVVQLVGLALIWTQGHAFVLLYAVTMLLSVLYSSPRPRWKGHPILSLVCVGIGTGTNTFLMGWLAGGDVGLTRVMVAAAIGVALLLLSLYPVSQVFQIEEDAARGDRTFAVAFGLAGVRRFFVVAYPVGLTIVSITLATTSPILGMAFGLVGVAGGLLNGRTLFRLRGEPSEYRVVMRMKYGASLSFVFFLVACLVSRGIPGFLV